MHLGSRITQIFGVVAIVASATLLTPAQSLVADNEPPILYVFPFSKVAVNYPRDHIDYPAVDVNGCYARVLAPTAGTITKTRTIDKWTKETDAPGTRGGKTITLVGDDNVRYYFAHLGKVKVATGQRVSAGDWIGVMGSSGNARVTRCHTHLGISRVCPLAEVYLLRGEIWPQKYLNAWRTGQQLSPKNAIKRLIKEDPLGCTRSRADTEAALTQKTG
jgi:murein DD-endopeptidase MepM/ murein hydrolase activator NlpD